MLQQKLFTSTWQNTGMDNQVIWLYQTTIPNGKFGSKVGNYSAISADHRRMYHIIYGNTAVEYNGFVYYVEDEVHYNYGNTPQMACNEFITKCEAVYFNGRTDVSFEDMAINMMDMSARFELGWVLETYISDEDYCERYRIYSADFAKKLHLGQKCVYCFSKKSAEEAMREFIAEGRTVRFNGKKEEVIMMYPDGSCDEDVAYVVYYEDDDTDDTDDADDADKLVAILEEEALRIYLESRCYKALLEHSDELERIASEFLNIKGNN